MPVIRLKRGTGVPSSLQYGEPAVDMTNHRLYLGNQSGQPVGYNLGASGFLWPRTYEPHSLFSKPQPITWADNTHPMSQDYNNNTIKFFAFIVENYYTARNCAVVCTFPFNTQVTLLWGFYSSKNSSLNKKLVQPHQKLVSGAQVFTIDNTSFINWNLSYDFSPGLYWLALKSGTSQTIRLRSLHQDSLRWCLCWTASWTQPQTGYVVSHNPGDPLPDTVPDWDDSFFAGGNKLYGGAPHVMLRCW